MDPRTDLQSIFLKAVEKVDPYRMIRDNLKLEGETLVISHQGDMVRVDLSQYPRILVLGIGKASVRMARAVEELLASRITEGAVITKYGQKEALQSIEVFEASHPIPDENSILAAQALNELARKADDKTLVLVLISGGGSALMSLPREGIGLRHLMETTGVLLKSGADIREVNCIRKHLSLVKGGGFARSAYPARIISLILSDVVGDRLDTIASGITVPDHTTFAQALSIVEKYGIRTLLPVPVMSLLESGGKGLAPETPKEGDPVFDRVSNIILGNNAAACRAARDHAAALGYHPSFLTSSLSGEAREIAKVFTALAKDILRGSTDFPRPALIVAGGETTVTVRGKGRGGRNQEMALSFFSDLLETQGSLTGAYFLSAGTDGIDGPTDAAGAIVDPSLQETVERARIDPALYLAENDSYHFFERTGGLFITGPTGTNVGDIELLAVP